MSKYIDCKDCEKMYHCDHTFMEGCFDGKEFDKEDFTNMFKNTDKIEPLPDIDTRKIGKDKKIIKFILNGCDISFIAEAPADITIEQLLKQCDKIKPDWCACGICSYEKVYKGDFPTDIFIDYDSIKKANDDVSCRIVEG